MDVSLHMMVQMSSLQSFLNTEDNGNPPVMDSLSSQDEEEEDDTEGTGFNATALQGVP